MKIFRTFLFLLLPFTLLACTPVKSWERGNLARPEMAFANDALEEKIQDHIYFSKEGSSSTIAGSGGGCGCN